jgi:Reverse transcriptase (RNA-dependent DNA polymerase)
LHGFRPYRSCQTALISLTNRLFAARGNGLYSAVVSLDYSKAFDCLNHELLLQKLRRIGATDNTVSWFRSYLTGRQQRVKYNNSLSDPLPVSSGVPQGSVFGPQLFNIYVNDLLLQLPPEGCVAYADDITLIGTGNTAEDARNAVQQIVNIVANWSHANCLSLNTAKCNIMYISPMVRQKKTVTVQSIMLNGNELSIVERMTILGVIITNDLSWTTQARKVQATISGRLSVLRRLGPVLNFRTRLQLYNAFIKSRLLYCLPVWGNCPMTCQHAIDRTLRRCARFVLNVNEAELTRNVFNITNICSLSHCVLISNVCTVFKSINMDKTDGFSPFKLRACVSQRTTRATESNKIEASIVCRKCDDYCFLSAGPASWNKLDNITTSCKNFSSFKNKVFTYISSLLN